MSILGEFGFKNTELREIPASVIGNNDFDGFAKITTNAINKPAANVTQEQIAELKQNGLFVLAGNATSLHRNDQNLTSRTLAFLDVDGVNDPALFVKNAVSKLDGLRYIVYPTISAGVDCKFLTSHKNDEGIYWGYRVVVDLSRAVIKSEYKRIVDALTEKLGITIDGASKTWSQHMGVPVRTPFNDTEHNVVIHPEGKPFDVDTALVKPVAPLQPVESSAKSHHTLSQATALSAIASWSEKHADELGEEAFFVRTIRFLIEEENEGRLSQSTVDAAGKLLALHNHAWEADNQAKIDTQRREHLEKNKLSFNQFFSSAEGPDWVISTEKGKPMTNALSNVDAWLSWDIANGKTGLKSLRFNSFTNVYEIEDEKGTRNLTDNDIRNLMRDMQKLSCFNVTKDASYDGIYFYGDQHSYNPVVDAIKAAKWDGEKRIDNLFTTYLGAEDGKYTQKISRVWLLQLVNRLVKPGAKADIVPILVGQQGLGKSTFARRLAWSEEYFSDSLKDMMGNKDELSKLAGKCVVELGELNSMRKSSIEDTKSFISKQSDDYRPAYARTTQSFKRTASFIGTSNYSDVLVDSTGDRRFWPISCGVIKPAKSVFDLDDKDPMILQLYAEAYAALEAGEKPYLTHDEIVAMMPNQSEFKKYDLVSSALSNVLGVLTNQGKTRVTRDELSRQTLRMAHTIEDENGDNADRSKLNYASVLSRVGKLMSARVDWTYKRVRSENGTRTYMYVLEDNK